MGSKIPPSSWSSEAIPQEDGRLDRPAPFEGPASNKLLRRIAGALQVPPSALYAPPDAVSIAVQPDALGRVEDECVLLVHAYRLIRDPEMRRRLLILAQEAAERSDS
jgi:hypothetical protein